LKSAGWFEFKDFERKCFDPDDLTLACGFLTNQDRHNMYQMFFIWSIKVDTEGAGSSGTKTISEESYGQLKELRGMLGLSEDEGIAQI
jgi:hypothetical protein